MLFMGLFSWWYGVGWLQLLQRTAAKIAGVLDFFSMGLLLKTLFAPYRQISVGHVQGPIGQQLRAWFDLQISRLIGAIVRLAVIVFGLIATILVIVVSGLLIILWLIMPALPVVAVVMLVSGV